MDLDKIKEQANNIKKYEEMLINQYQEIVSSLTKIYNIISRQSPLSHKISELISKYNNMISEMPQKYASSTNQILNYVENSKRNLSELEKNLSNSIQILKDVL